ncbi:MAG: HD domain-containing protein [Deltaproteobacteria bacterium]|nr:HD domain-containing protein [Deltaproteobacteria bacterium]
MLLRDPVHGLVVFEADDERVVLALLDTAEVQRLRRVRQLGLTSVVFPGAEHSRFAHALGTAHVMVRLLRRLAAPDAALDEALQIDGHLRRTALAAALLHDLGHGPFSHLFEEVFPGGRHHEAWTGDIVNDDTTEVHAALSGLDRELPARVASLLSGDAGAAAPELLARSISGALDVDRCDYLLRDSLMTGVRYGLYDLEWVLQSLRVGRVTPGSDRLVLAVDGRKGLPALEGYFLGRQFMYQQVYHHKATRGAECLVRAIFKRVVERVQDGHVPPLTPRAIVDASLGRQVALGDYLAMDDVIVGSSFAAWERGSDPLLADLCARLRTRRLFKTVRLPDEPAAWPEARARALDVVRSLGLRDDLYLWLDVATHVPYPEPDGALDDAHDVVLVLEPGRGARPLGDASFLLGELRNKAHVRPRLVFAPEARRAVVSALEGLA